MHSPVGSILWGHGGSGGECEADALASSRFQASVIAPHVPPAVLP